MDNKQERRLRRHRWVWKHLDWLVLLLAKLKFGPFTMEPAPALAGGYLVLPNHACSFDQFFVAFSFLKRHMYFMVSEHAFRKKLVGALMDWLAGPISRVKGGVDGAAVMAVLRWLRRGVPVCIFPEGERSWDGRTAALHPSTAKLVRASGVPLVTYRITGGYLSDPRWSKTLRKGPLHGQVVGVYQPEQLKRMKLPEIEALVSRDLWVDAYAAQRPVPSAYKGKRLAEGLEEALFLCPGCGKVGSLRGRGNVLSCACGVRATYDEFGFFDAAAPFRTVADWDDWQADALRELAGRDGPLLEDAGGAVWELREGHRMERRAEGTVTLDRAGLRVAGLRFPLADMGRPSLCHFAGYETLMFSCGGKSYELRFRGSASRRKYRLLLLALMERQPSTEAL